MTKSIAKNVELFDDDTEFGGISYLGETLDHFMGEVGLFYGSSLKKVNAALVECGIKPLNMNESPLNMIK